MKDEPTVGTDERPVSELAPEVIAPGAPGVG
jgi:hypothetical protein